jgi:hypothetical protein
MKKQDAQAQLTKLEAEVKRLREIIEAPEQQDRLWKPREGEQYYCLNSWAAAFHVQVSHHTDDERSEFGNCFPTESAANKAAPMFAVAHKIIVACIQVDPDFVPDWEDDQQEKHRPTFLHGKWSPSVWAASGLLGAAVSTKQKCEQVCRILNNEGVKP